MMFKWLAKQFTPSDEDVDSLGSEKGLEAFLAALPVTVPARTVDALGEPFENAGSLEIAPEKLGRPLSCLDERAQEPLNALWQSLFTDASGRQVADGPWLGLARYYRNCHAGYRRYLGALPGRTEQTDEQRSAAVLIATRAMGALARYKTLLRMRYRDVDEAYWNELNGLAAWSAGFGSTSTLIELYPRSGYQSSVEREYLIAHLFEVAPLANLLPAQMIALDLILRRFAANYHFSDSYRESAPFVLEPSRNQPARRWLKGLTVRPGQRFFGAGAAYAQLAGVSKQANASAEIPQWVALARLDVESYRGLLDLLVKHWSVQPPQRRHRRDRGQGELLVTHGVGQVRRMIAASEYAQAGGQLNYQDNSPYDHKLFGRLRFGSVGEQAPAGERDAPQATPMQTLQKFELEGDRQMTERWTIVDISESGLGAIAQAHAGWARVGMLLGLRRADTLDWQIAIVRRLGRSPEGKLSIGMQTLEARTCCARLRFGSADDAGNPWIHEAGSTDVFHDAILLLGEGEPSVLLDLGVFTGPGECMLSFEKRWHRARLERSMEQGYDYERVGLAILPQTSGAQP